MSKNLLFLVLLALIMISCKTGQVDSSQQAAIANAEPDNSYFLERDKWEQADKSSLEALSQLRNSFTTEQMRETASDYIYAELDKEIRNHAKWKGLPKKYHDLQVCVISQCKETMLYEVFRKFALSYLHVLARGFSDFKARANNREIVLILVFKDKAVVQFHFRINGQKAMLYQISVNNDKSTDPSQIQESGEPILTSLSEWPAEEEINYLAIDIVRSSKGKKSK